MPNRAPEPFRLQLIAVDSIRPTERIVDAHAHSLGHEMRIAGVWTHPLLVERSMHALLDGHHRLAAAVALGLACVPAIVVDYDDPAIRLESWRPNERFTREQVLAVAANGALLPVKSTRHLVDAPLPRCRVALERLVTKAAVGEEIAAAATPPSREQLLFAFYHEHLQRMGLRSVTAQEVMVESAATLVPHPHLRRTLQNDPAMAALLPGLPCRIGLGRREHAPFRVPRPELLLLSPALLDDPAALACAVRWGVEGVDRLGDGAATAGALGSLLRFGAALAARLEPASRARLLEGVPAPHAVAIGSGRLARPGAALLRWQASLLGIRAPSVGIADTGASDGPTAADGDAMDELELPLESLLVGGGDSRLRCEGPGGFNRYGVPPRPRPEAVHFSSSTASAISDHGFLFCDLLRRDLLAARRREGLDGPELGRRLAHAIAAELRALLALEETEADLVGCASGTDAELASMVLALAAADGRRVTNLLVSPGESGRGVGLAAAGRHFDTLASDGRTVTHGAPIWPDAEIEVREIAIRGTGTDPRRLEEIDREYLELGRAALARGDHLVAHLLATSKTGLVAPSLAAVERLVAIAPERVDVVVDACQMRWRFEDLGALVRRGWSVQISGSKFLTGPPFSGALVFPVAWRERLAGVRARLAARPGTAHPADWSSWWSHALGGAEPAPPPSRAYLFRWLPAILEARLLLMLPDALLEHAFARFREAMRERIAESVHLESIDDGDTEAARRAEVSPADAGGPLGQRTIVCFRVLGADADGALHPLDEAACRELFEWLNTDLSERLGSLGAEVRGIAAQACHIGQPVSLGVGGEASAVLRLVLGARFFTTVGHAGPGAIDAALESEIADAQRALDKLDLLAANRWRLVPDADVPASEASEPATLDPSDWAAFGREAHRLLDGCLERLVAARARPWRPPSESRRPERASPPRDPSPIDALVDEWLEEIVPFATGNAHPRFFGWVHGAGLADGVLAELVAATMNSNCGGRDHAAIAIERELLGWCRELFGLPSAAGGLVTGGTSIATLLALSAARVATLGHATRQHGLAGGAPLAVYAAEGVHQCARKALEVMGIGSSALVTLPLERPGGSLALDALDAALARDRARGTVPLCVIGTAGSVDTGRFDDLERLADLCAERALWLHVDGAFGAWAVLAEEPWRALAQGIGRADSLAFDFHKWPSVPYEAGAVLVRDETLLRDAFAARTDYLEAGGALAGGAPWPCDSGLELSRGFRALKVWSAFRHHGTRRLGASISANCAQARRFGALVETSEALELAAPVTLNVCCARVAAPALAARGIDPTAAEAVDAAHREIAARLQLAGRAVLSTTRIEGRLVLRAAIVNHRTRLSDVDTTVEAIVETIATL